MHAYLYIYIYLFLYLYIFTEQDEEEEDKHGDSSSSGGGGGGSEKQEQQSHVTDFLYCLRNCINFEYSLCYYNSNMHTIEFSIHQAFMVAGVAHIQKKQLNNVVESHNQEQHQNYIVRAMSIAEQFITDDNLWASTHVC